MMTPKLIEAVNRAVVQGITAGIAHAKRPERPLTAVIAEVQVYGRALVQHALEQEAAKP